MKKKQKLQKYRSQHESRWLSEAFFLKEYLNKWFSGVSKTMHAIIHPFDDVTDENCDMTFVKQERENRSKIIKNRGDLSRTRTDEEIYASIFTPGASFGNKGFFGTALPLIPDIRRCEVIDGALGTLLKAFGVQRKFDNKVVLHRGPNKKANRYLILQYKRLIKTMEGQPVFGTTDTPAHVVWNYDMYKLNKQLAITRIERTAKFETAMRKWKILSQTLNFAKPKMEAPSFEEVEMEKVTKRKLRKIARIYWGISNQLIRNSTAFRMAVIKKSMGKAKRWFHRNFDISELFDIKAAYQEIADVYGTDMQVKRCWINPLQSNGTRKWRPLGLTSWAWRLYTKGINNLLETFISAGWPNNQHGYKSGRGVHTIWNQILHSVIKAKNIFEFDFKGFFNTVRVEAVGNVLYKFGVPKYMISNLLLINSGDIENISIARMLYLTRRLDPDEQGWAAAWRKYEYIHKYRKRYRSEGLAQGGVLSPILSVLTLIVMDELEEYGIKYLLYCDDGLMYSDDRNDLFMEIGQSILNKHGIGAQFSEEKSKWVKRNDVWESKLKFVGLEYDPFEDTLSAATRNGATLTLKIGAIGLFSENPFIRAPIPEIVKEKTWEDWSYTNALLFDIYEDEFIAQGFPRHRTDELAENTYKIMFDRLTKYKDWDLERLINETGKWRIFFDFLLPIRLLRSIDMDRCDQLVRMYEEQHDLIKFPWKYLMEDENIKSKFWMETDLTSQEINTISQYRRMCKTRLASATEINPSYLFNDGNVGNLDLLSWFKDLETIPSDLEHLFKDGKCELGEWFNCTIENLDIGSVPAELVEHVKGNLSWFAVTQVTWHNLYMDPVFATFVARLFENSFKPNTVKQNFKLEDDKDKNSIMKLIKRYIGPQSFAELTDGLGLNVFNSSSFCANLYAQLLEYWSPTVRSPVKAKVPGYKRAYKSILTKVANRRTCVDDFPEAFSDEWGYAKEDWDLINRFLITPDSEEQGLIDKYPLIPLTLVETAKHKATRKHLLKKFENVTSLDIETIARSAVSTHARYTVLNVETGEISRSRTGNVPNYKGVRWDTLSPRKPRKKLTKE